MTRTSMLVVGFLALLGGGLARADDETRAPGTQPTPGAAGSTDGAPAVETARPRILVAQDFNSSYVWRGIAFSKGGVYQPSIDISGIKVGQVSLGVNVWSNMNLSDWHERLQSGQFSEVDFTLTASLPAGFKASYIEYIFAIGGATDFSPIPEPSTREVMLGWSRELAVTPALSLYYDVEQIDDYFLVASVSRGFKLAQSVQASLALETGLAGKKYAQYYGGTKGGFYHYAMAGRLTYQATETLGLSATLGYARGFDEKILPRKLVDAAAPEAPPVQIGLYGPYAGVNVSLGL